MDMISKNDFTEERQPPTLLELLHYSLVTHASKVMLRVIINRLIKQAGEITEEEHTSFQKGRGNIEEIFNLCTFFEKYQ